jgi:hypothetical protein
MKKRLPLIISTFPLLVGLGACSKAPKTYYPLAQGRTWTYQVSFKLQTLFGGEQSGTLALANLAPRQLDGKSVTPQKMEMQIGGSSHYEFQYMVDDSSGVYEFAEQDSGDVEPKVKSVPEYTLKEPVKAGTSWSATVTSLSGPSVPGEATIESTDEAVDVPAGSFKDCVKVHIVGTAKGATGNEEYEWFAPSVGLVKDIFKSPNGTGSVVLVSFTK